MKKAAVECMQHAYAPYSRLKVGAAVLTKDGIIFSGCNVENAVFSNSICAERTALVKAVAEGHRRIREVLVTSSAEEPLLPCGTCLQTISEFAESRRTRIISIGKSGKTETHEIGKLFPSGIKVYRVIRKITP